MNELQKQKIVQYRNNGLSYNKISSLMNLSVNSIKSFCQRNNLGGVKSLNDTICTCENCGTLFSKVKGKKHKRFCSDKCRNSWWNNHQDQVKRKAYNEFTCACCNKKFISYGSRHRKYCSHECYIRDRFGGTDNGKN